MNFEIGQRVQGRKTGRTGTIQNLTWLDPESYLVMFDNVEGVEEVLASNLNPVDVLMKVGDRVQLNGLDPDNRPGTVVEASPDGNVGVQWPTRGVPTRYFNSNRLYVVGGLVIKREFVDLFL